MSPPKTTSLSTSRPHAELDLDVLIHIMWFSPPHWSPDSYALSMMRTCRALYDAGLPILLDRVQIRLNWYRKRRGNDQLAKFCQFIARDKPRRCQLIRNISLIFIGSRDNFIESAAGVVDQLVSILACCDKLQSLALPDCEVWMMYEPIPQVLNTLVSLRELKLSLSDAEQDNTMQSLSDLKPPKLQRLIVQRDDDYDTYMGCPLTEMRSSDCRTTLEILQFPKCLLQPVPDVYPMLKDLILDTICIDLAHIGTITSALMRSLPNLQRLLLVGSPDESLYLIGSREDVYPDEVQIHWSNQEEQYKGYMWPCLDTLSCADIDALYLLAIACPVRYLQILGHIDFFEQFKIKAILDDCRPSVLTVKFKMEECDDSRIPTLIPEECARGMTQLSIAFHFPSRLANMDTFLANIYTLLQGMPLTFLDIGFYDVHGNDSHKRFRRMNMDLIVDELAERVPTLRYLTLRKLGFERSWEIHRGEDRPTITKQPQVRSYNLEEFGMGDHPCVPYYQE